MRHLAFLAVVLCAGGFAAHVARGQAPANSPKLDQPFTFTLAPHRDYAVSAITRSVEQHDEFLRREELEAVNAPMLSKVLDLLRYVPLQLGASDDDGDFFTPSYLRRDYARLPSEFHLFDNR